MLVAKSVACAAFLLCSAGAAAQATFADVSPNDPRSPADPGVQAVAVHTLEAGRLVVIANGRLQLSRDGGVTWADPAVAPEFGLVDQLYAHKGRPHVLYLQELANRMTVGFMGDIRRSGGRAYRSDDFGETWALASPGYEEEEDLALSPRASNPATPEHLFATLRSPFVCTIACGLAVPAMDKSLVESRDYGRTWTPLPLPFVPLGTFEYLTLMEPTPGAPSRFIVRANAGSFVSVDNGMTWAPFSTASLGRHAWLEQDPGEPSVFYGLGYTVDGAGVVMRSDDGGASWRPVRMVGGEVPSLTIDPASSARLWLSGPAGLWLSDDGGGSWTNLGLAAEAHAYPPTAITFVAPAPTDSARVYVIKGRRLLRGNVEARGRIAIEYQYGDRFWIAGGAGEARSQDYRMNEALRSGQRFGLWSPLDAPAGAIGICRFQGVPARGQSSRFLTLQGPECETLRRDAAWALEGENESFALPPTADGGCGNGGVPVRRFYNGDWNANHRYVADAGAAAQMRTRGWIEEGVAFCARPLESNE